MKSNFLIYGSYGYTGSLIAELACQQGLRPVLGGRNKDKLAEQAKALNLDYRVFDLTDAEQTKEAIRDVTAVIHCAGPFIDTYRPMAAACLATQTHYLDITGEVTVIEHLARMDAKAKAAGILLLPGAGFDVVPTDCLAQHLKSRLPDASELALAIYSRNASKTSKTSISRGTARTAVRGLAYDTFIRDGGKLVPAPASTRKRVFEFENKREKMCAAFTWGDLASAWWSTRIPHIETYMATTSKLLLLSSLIRPFKFIFKLPIVKRVIENRINKLPEGPSVETRQNSHVEIAGQVKNQQGKAAKALLHTPEAYQFTALAALLLVNKVLAGSAPTGFQTPSTAFGKDVVLEIPGVTRIDLD